MLRQLMAAAIAVTWATAPASAAEWSAPWPARPDPLAVRSSTENQVRPSLTRVMSAPAPDLLPDGPLHP